MCVCITVYMYIYMCVYILVCQEPLKLGSDASLPNVTPSIPVTENEKSVSEAVHAPPVNSLFKFC